MFQLHCTRQSNNVSADIMASACPAVERTLLLNFFFCLFLSLLSRDGQEIVERGKDHGPWVGLKPGPLRSSHVGCGHHELSSADVRDDFESNV